MRADIYRSTIQHENLQKKIIRSTRFVSLIIIIIIGWHAHYVSVAVSTILRHKGRSCAWYAPYVDLDAMQIVRLHPFVCTQRRLLTISEVISSDSYIKIFFTELQNAKYNKFGMPMVWSVSAKICTPWLLSCFNYYSLHQYGCFGFDHLYTILLHSVGASIVLLVGVCRRLSSSVVLHGGAT